MGSELSVVFHDTKLFDADGPATTPYGPEYVPDIERLQPVALVATNDKERAWERTQTIDHPWWEGKTVTPLFEGDGTRSTSVGDVILTEQEGQPVAYVARPVGFEILTEGLIPLMKKAHAVLDKKLAPDVEEVALDTKGSYVAGVGIKAGDVTLETRMIDLRFVTYNGVKHAPITRQTSALWHNHLNFGQFIDKCQSFLEGAYPADKGITPVTLTHYAPSYKATWIEVPDEKSRAEVRKLEVVLPKRTPRPLTKKTEVPAEAEIPVEEIDI